MVVSVCFLIGCKITPIEKPPIFKGDVIDISQIENNYIDLSKYGQDVQLTGEYQGMRIVLKNAAGKNITFKDASIESTSTDEAIVITDSDKVNIDFDGVELNNGLAIWKSFSGCKVSNLTVIGGKYGLKMNDTIVNSNTLFHNLHFENQSKEGVYVGPYYDHPNKLFNLTFNNVFVKNSSWDGFQLGNCVNCIVSNLTVEEAGVADEGQEKTHEWQSWPVTINPGSLVHITNLNVIPKGKRIQNLTSKVFEYTK